MDRYLVKRKRSNEPAKPAKTSRTSEEIGWARCPICDATVAISVMGQHVDSGCKEFAGAKRRKSEAAAAPPSIFAVPHETLGGQYIVADFLSEEEEAEILAFLDDPTADPPWKDCRFNGKHRGKHWGVRIDIAAGKLLEQTHAMPDVLRRIVLKMRTVDVLQTFYPNECNAIDYVKAQGATLKAHCDHRGLSGDVLVNLCLAGSATMTYTKDGEPDAASYRVLLPRRGLQVQTGEVRYSYRHGISNADLHDARRVSITFRSNKDPNHHV